MEGVILKQIGYEIITETKKSENSACFRTFQEKFNKCGEFVIPAAPSHKGEG